MSARAIDRRLLGAMLVCSVLTFASALHAQDRAIGPGQEAAVLALFAPYALAAPVAHGYALWNVAIESAQVVVTLRAADGRETTLTLQHPEVAHAAALHTASFAVLYGGVSDGDALAARAALLAAIQRNDDGAFWGESATAVVDDAGVRVDGIVAIALIFALASLLAGRLLVDAPRWIGPALLGTLVAGALVRLALSPQIFLGAWPWSRLYVHARAVAVGPVLAAYAEHSGQTIYLTDVMLWTSFAYAVVMPLVLFSHATYLLRDARAGLAASFAIAFLPQHVRYSISEDGFVGSLVLTSLAFALIHGALRDESKIVRWLLLLALPWVLYPGYLLRPLNILFIVVYTAAILFLHAETAPRWRRALVLGVVLAVGAAASVAFFEQHEKTVEAISILGWLGSVLGVLVSPRLMVMTDPTRTPFVLIVLAVLGGVLTWRAGERRLVSYLLAWLLLFVVAHAVVVQESMQPRYHMHLVVPFLLLGASAVTRIEARHRRWLWAAAAFLVASPWVHRGFVQDIDYTELREYEFVHRARALVPAECTVIEYTGGENRRVDELRFSRIGVIAGPDGRHKFRAIGVFPDGRPAEGQPSIDALLRDPPECLYFYEGLACSAWRGRNENYAAQCLALRLVEPARHLLATVEVAQEELVGVVEEGRALLAHDGGDRAGLGVDAVDADDLVAALVVEERDGLRVRRPVLVAHVPGVGEERVRHGDLGPRRHVEEVRLGLRDRVPGLEVEVA